MRRVLSVVLVVLILISISVPAYSIETTHRVNNSVKSGIINVLNYIEMDKGNYGLDAISFETLLVGSAIHVYEYTANGYVEIRNYYPLFSGSSVVALALNMGGGNYQLETMLAKAISETKKTKIAIVYDDGHCYLYDGEEFILLWNVDTEVEGRCVLPSNKNSTNVNHMMLADLSKRETLGYYSNSNARAQTYYSCNVGYVTAQPYGNLCWAGSCAMIINYLKGTSYSAARIAQNYFGSTDSAVFNQGLSTSGCSEVLSSYGCGYNNIYYLSNNLIFTNIYNGYPLFVSCNLSNGLKHACVISGVNLTAGYITVMDPAGGTYTVYQSGSSYAYVPSYAGYTITLNIVICRLAS